MQQAGIILLDHSAASILLPKPGALVAQEDTLTNMTALQALDQNWYSLGPIIINLDPIFKMCHNQCSDIKIGNVSAWPFTLSMCQNKTFSTKQNEKTISLTKNKMEGVVFQATDRKPGANCFNK